MNRFIKIWQDVRDKIISIYFSENEQKVVIRIPEAIVEIPNGLRMLDFLFQEEINNQFESTSENPEIYFSEHEEKLPRFMVRIHFLVNFVVMFEVIFNRSYTSSIAVLRKYNSEVKVAEKPIQKRWTEISNIWHKLLKGTGIDPIDMHSPLWFWSRSNFQYRLPIN